MTNAEIEQFASDLYQLALDGDYFGVEDKGAAKLREMLSQALEEARMLATEHEEHCGQGCGSRIADDIRALKDLLAPPVVSSR